MLRSDKLKPVTAIDGTVWDGTIDIVIGKTIYYGTPRDVNVVRSCPLFTRNSEIVGFYTGEEPQEVPVFGWVRINDYMGDDRYWVDEGGGYIPVYATAEKPV